MYGLEEPDEIFIVEMCTLIIDTKNALNEQITDTDYNRVYCNLGKLKILYKKGMVDNAHASILYALLEKKLRLVQEKDYILIYIAKKVKKNYNI